MLNFSRSANFGSTGFATRSCSSSQPASLARVPKLSTLRSELKDLTSGKPMLVRLQELHSSSLYLELREWAKVQSAIAGTPESVIRGQRNAAEAHALTYALQALVEFGNRYELASRIGDLIPAAGSEALESEFLRQINSRHRNNLLNDFSQSFNAESDERKASVLSVLSPELVDRLRADGVLACSEDDMKHGNKAPGQRLGEAELLALLDYVNSSTGTFNALNGTAITRDYYGEPVLASAVAVFRSALYSAVDKLCGHESFVLHNVPAYKGIRLNDLASGFRLHMLEGALAHRGRIAFPSVLSASSDPDKSYFRTKFDLGYTIELQLTMPIACAVDAFHDVSTKGEQEILAPAGQRYRVTGKSEQAVMVPEQGAEFIGYRYDLAPE